MNIDSYWEYSDPAASEARFRAALPQATADERLELLTQIARTHSLRRQFGASARAARRSRTATGWRGSRAARALPARARPHLQLGGRQGACGGPVPAGLGNRERRAPRRARGRRRAHARDRRAAGQRRRVDRARRRTRARVDRRQGARPASGAAEQPRLEPARRRPPRRGAARLPRSRSGVARDRPAAAGPHRHVVGRALPAFAEAVRRGAAAAAATGAGVAGRRQRRRLRVRGDRREPRGAWPARGSDGVLPARGKRARQGSAVRAGESGAAGAHHRRWAGARPSSLQRFNRTGIDSPRAFGRTPGVVDSAAPRAARRAEPCGQAGA